MNNFLLDILAISAIISGIFVITSKNPVISVLFLVSVFINIAGYLILLGIGFIGISYIIVYVGAIAILFLFVIIMLNLQLAELSAVGKEYTKSLPLGVILGSLFLFEILSVIPYNINNSESININTSNIQLGIFNYFNNYITGFNNYSKDIHLSFNSINPDSNISTFIQIESIGSAIYTYGAIWLFVASLILILSIIGPIVLNKK